MSRTPIVPTNEAASIVGRPVPPIAASRSQTSVRGQASQPATICHIPAKMSPAFLDGIITAEVIREYPHVIASTGSTRSRPPPTGTAAGGNHKSHCATSPGAYSTRSAGSGGTNSGRSSRTRSFKTVIDRVQPIRSAITVAGIRGNSASSARICGSTSSTSDPRGPRSREGGPDARNAARTVLRASPSRRAISLIETPSARCSRRTSAHSSSAITPPASRRGSVPSRRQRVSLNASSTRPVSG